MDWRRSFVKKTDASPRPLQMGNKASLLPGFNLYLRDLCLLEISKAEKRLNSKHDLSFSPSESKSPRAIGL
jgi:hypothetical protein